MRLSIFLLAIFAMPAFADDPHHDHKTPAQVVVVEKHEHATAALALGAGITYWLIKRHQRKQGQPLVLVPPPPELLVQQ